MFKSVKRELAKDRLFEEKLYEQVVLEIQNGDKRNGLWAKALSHSNGNEEKARAKYIGYRVQSIKDEIDVAEEIIEREEELKKQRDDGWCILFDWEDLEIARLFSKAKNKKANHTELKLLCHKMGIKAEGKVGLFKDSWVIEGRNGKRRKYNDSDDLESFLVRQYSMRT